MISNMTAEDTVVYLSWFEALARQTHDLAHDGTLNTALAGSRMATARAWEEYVTACGNPDALLSAAPFLIRAKDRDNEVTDLQELAGILATSSDNAVAVIHASREPSGVEIAQGAGVVNGPLMTPLRALATTFLPATRGSLVGALPP